MLQYEQEGLLIYEPLIPSSHNYYHTLWVFSIKEDVESAFCGAFFWLQEKFLQFTNLINNLLILCLSFHGFEGFLSFGGCEVVHKPVESSKAHLTCEIEDFYQSLQANLLKFGMLLQQTKVYRYNLGLLI